MWKFSCNIHPIFVDLFFQKISIRFDIFYIIFFPKRLNAIYFATLSFVQIKPQRLYFNLVSVQSFFNQNYRRFHTAFLFQSNLLIKFNNKSTLQFVFKFDSFQSGKKPDLDITYFFFVFFSWICFLLRTSLFNQHEHFLKSIHATNLIIFIIQTNFIVRIFNASIMTIIGF